MEDRGRKNAKTRRETSVQGTNDSSVVSKCSTATCGYFDDQFLHHFVAKQSRRAPLIHRGYYIRAMAFDRIFKKFLAENCGIKTQIISMGCGFDSTYFRLKESKLLQNTTFFEVDFPDLVKRKHKIIESKQTLLDFLEVKQERPLSPHIEMSCQDYHLLGVDLTQLNTLEAALKMCGIDFEAPTLLFSECVMTYMTRRCSTDVVRWASETFENGTFIMYEQMNPEDAFGLFMQRHFHSIGSPLKCINAFPSLDSQRQRFLKNGWPFCEAVDMNTFYYKCLSSEEKRLVESLEAFDEYEELNLKYSHYFILVATTMDSGFSYLTSESESNDTFSKQVASTAIGIERITSSNNIRRFGHTSSLLSKNHIVTAGGFGEVDGRHQRLTDITITDTDSLQSFHIPCVSPEIQFSRMHHASVTLSDGSVYLIAGRQSPYFLCSQMLKLNLDVTDKALISNSSENHGDSDRSSHVPREFVKNGDKESENGCEKIISDACCDSSNGAKNQRTAQSNGVRIPDSGEHVSDVSGPLVWKCPYGALQVQVVSQSGDVPCNRSRHAATTVTVNGVEKIFQHGGKMKSGEILDDTFLFDPHSSEWSRVPCSGDVPSPRHSHQAVAWNQFVVLSGGLDDCLVPLTDIHLLDLNTRVWERCQVAGDLHARYSHTAQVLGDHLVLIGGVHLSHPPPGVAVVNLNSRKASEYTLPVSDPSNLLMLHRITSVKISDHKIVILGGGGNCFSFGTHLNHTPVMFDLSRAIQVAQ